MKDPGVAINRTICQEALRTTCHECEKELIILPNDTIYCLQMSCYPYICERCYSLRLEGKAHDPVNSPSHYNSHPSGVECIDITRHYSCMIGSAIKYLWRAGLKQQQYAFVVDPNQINLKAVKELHDKRLQPGSFIKIDPTAQPRDAVRLLGDYSKAAELEDLNKALFCIMEEIDRLGGEVTARPREKKDA